MIRNRSDKDLTTVEKKFLSNIKLLRNQWIPEDLVGRYTNLTEDLWPYFVRQLASNDDKEVLEKFVKPRTDLQAYQQLV
jgi:hypothetical protein